jgi:prevent-host-death family protein
MQNAKKSKRNQSPWRVARSWQLQHAKAKLSEVIRLAQSEGPQLITRQGVGGVVVVPVEQYNQLVGRKDQPTSLVEFFAQSPFVGLELNLERDKDTGREIEL